MAAGAVSAALTTATASRSTQYPRAARGDVRPLLEGGAARSCGRSATRPSCASSRASGMQSRPLMEWVLRIMANLLRPDELGPAEAAYKMVAALVAVAPDPS